MSKSFNYASETQKKLMEMQLDDRIISAVGGGVTWVSTEEALEITGNNFTFGKYDGGISLYTDEDYQEDLKEMNSLVHQRRIERFSFIESLPIESHKEIKEEKKLKQKPSTLLLNLMRNI